MDPFIEKVIFFSVIAVLFFAGVFSNGFIMMVNFVDKIKGRSLNAVDRILVALSISNTSFSCIYGVYIFCEFFWLRFHFFYYAFPVLFALTVCATTFSSWLSAVLCVFYCIKIVNFKTRYSTWLKMNIDSAFAWLILFSFALSLSNSLPMIWSFERTFQENATTPNSTSGGFVYRLDPHYYMSLATNTLVSVLLVIFSTVSIMYSLHQHTCHMEKTKVQTDVSLKVHHRAAKTMLSLLLVYLVFYVAVILLSLLPADSTAIWIVLCLSVSFSPAQAAILILGSPKLRDTFLKMCLVSKTKESVLLV